MLLAFFNVKAQNCNIGNSDNTSEYTAYNFQKDLLLGVKYTLDREGTLNSMNLIGNDTGALVQMAVFDTYNNAPYNLVASSQMGIVGEGLLTLAPESPVVLPAGDYWVMAIYSKDGYHSNVNQSATGNYVLYEVLTFGDPIPPTYTNSHSFIGSDFLYFLDITCPPTSDCNTGNSVSTPNFVNANFQANTMLGTKHTLTKEGTLYSLNMIGNNTGASVKMAIYDDNNGAPNNLIASSNVGTVGNGIVSLPISPVLLPPGDYWLMAIYDTQGYHSKANNVSANETVYYKTLPFEESTPTDASSFTTSQGGNFLYFLEIACTLPSECNLGNSVNTPDYIDTNFASNYLAGIKYSLPQEGTLNSINLIGNNTNANVQMAVYDDNNGVPNNLVASSSNSMVGSGRITLPVTPVVLPAGDYWIMAVYDTAGLHTKTNSTITENTVYYQNLTFGDLIPSNASDFSNFSGGDFLYFLDITCSTTSRCGIGNSSITSDFEAGYLLENYLAGTKHTLYEEGVLSSINLMGINTGAAVQMAVYGDNNGVPNNLVVASSIGVVTSGRVTFPVAQIVLPPGDYWIMAIYDTEGNHTYATSSNSLTSSYFTPISFGDPIPNNASDFFGGALGVDYIYFLDIECGDDTLSIIDDDLDNDIILYPNPSSDAITIAGLKQKEKYTLFDSLGRIIRNDYIMNEESIHIQNLDAGLYFIKFESGSTLKFIKK